MLRWTHKVLHELKRRVFTNVTRRHALPSTILDIVQTESVWILPLSPFIKPKTFHKYCFHAAMFTGSWRSNWWGRPTKTRLVSQHCFAEPLTWHIIKHRWTQEQPSHQASYPSGCQMHFDLFDISVMISIQDLEWRITRISTALSFEVKFFNYAQWC